MTPTQNLAPPGPRPALPLGAEYDREIRQLVPGYEVLHSLVPSLLGSLLGASSQILVVGCGTGLELASLAQQDPTWLIRAFDPCPAMLGAAQERVARGGLLDQVRLGSTWPRDLAGAGQHDAVLSLLVGHLVPDDGARARFMQELARQLRPGGLVLLAELLDEGELSPVLSVAHLKWAASRGVASDKLATVEGNLSGGLAALSLERLEDLAERAGLRVVCQFFRALGIAGLLLERS